LPTNLILSKEVVIRVITATGSTAVAAAVGVLHLGPRDDHGHGVVLPARAVVSVIKRFPPFVNDPLGLVLYDVLLPQLICNNFECLSLLVTSTLV